MSGQLNRALAVGLLLAAGVCSGDRLVVVHDTGDAVDAGRWIERLEISHQVMNKALDRGLEQLEDMAVPRLGELPVAFPIEAAPLRLGPATWVPVSGLSGTLFGIGPDDRSLRWLVANAAELRGRGAQGMLVSAASAATLHRVRAVALRHGLSLHPMPGAPLAEAYGVEFYPFVVEPSP